MNALPVLVVDSLLASLVVLFLTVDVVLGIVLTRLVVNLVQRVCPVVIRVSSRVLSLHLVLLVLLLLLRVPCEVQIIVVKVRLLRLRAQLLLLLLVVHLVSLVQKDRV